jgi:hypothetical protein
VNAPLNLARQPFRNERLPTLLLGLGTAALALATLRQSVVAYELLPGRARDVEAEVQSLEAETARLSSESASLRSLAAPTRHCASGRPSKGSSTGARFPGPASSPRSSRRCRRACGSSRCSRPEALPAPSYS